MRPSPPPHLPGSYLVLELTNRCSLACVHCSVSEIDHPHHAQTGYLSVDTAEAVFDDLARVGARFDSLVLFWLGEPLIHPHFLRIWQSAIRTAVRGGVFAKVEVHTNATHLSAAMTRGVLNQAALPQVWHFSLDAIERESYAKIKGKDRFEQVQKNVARFIRRRAETGAVWPRPVLQFIVGENNVDQISDFRSHWERVCAEAGSPVRAAAGHVPAGEDAIVFFRQLDCPTPEAQERTNELFREAMTAQGLLLPTQAVEGKQVRADNTTACSGFWKSPVVSWRGEVTTCTRDNLLENKVGSLGEASLSELWWGATMRGRRERVAQGDYAGLPPCATCFIPRSLNHSALDPSDIAVQAAWEAAV